MICKDCKQANHTINKCEKRTDSETYCEICQPANIHTAATCDIAAKLSRNADIIDAMNAMSLVPAGANSQFWSQNQACWICGDLRHLARQCPRAGYNQTRGYVRGRGGMPRGRGNFNGPMNDNFNQHVNRNQGHPSNYNQNHNNQSNFNQNFGGRTFHRGGAFHRGYFGGTSQGYPRNYNNYPNFGYPQNFNGQTFNRQNFTPNYPQISGPGNGWNPNWNQIPWQAINQGQPRNSSQNESSNPMITHTEGENSGNENPPLQYIKN